MVKRCKFLVGEGVLERLGLPALPLPKRRGDGSFLGQFSGGWAYLMLCGWPSRTVNKTAEKIKCNGEKQDQTDDL